MMRFTKSIRLSYHTNILFVYLYWICNQYNVKSRFYYSLY